MPNYDMNKPEEVARYLRSLPQHLRDGHAGYFTKDKDPEFMEQVKAEFKKQKAGVANGIIQAMISSR